MVDPHSVHAIYAIGPLAIAGIGMAASKLLGGAASGGKSSASPSYLALDEIRRRRLAELEQIRGFQNSLLGVGQEPQQPTPAPNAGTGSAGSGLLAILQRLRGMY